MSFGFQDQKRKGKLACKVVELSLLMHPEVRMVETVEDHPDWRTRGVDLLVFHKEQGKVLVEVKADSYPSRNCFLETKGDVEKGLPGCFLSSEADVWVYFYTCEDMALWLPLDAARAWFLEHESEFETRFVRNPAWASIGALVPVERIVEEVVGVEVLTDLWAGVKRFLDEAWAA